MKELEEFLGIGSMTVIRDVWESLDIFPVLLNFTYRENEEVAEWPRK